MELARILKPAPLGIKKKGHPEQLLKDWEDYLRVFSIFLKATGVAGVHASPEIAGTPCQACEKAKNILLLVGGEEVRTLFDHVGRVQDTDSWKETLGKVSKGIRQKINQAAARFKLMQNTPQSDSRRKSSSSGSCRTCTRPMHADGECPGRKVECFTCGLLGHFKGSAVCKKKKGTGGKKRKEKANQVDDELFEANEDSEMDSIGRIVEVVRERRPKVDLADTARRRVRGCNIAMKRVKEGLNSGVVTHKLFILRL